MMEFYQVVLGFYTATMTMAVVAQEEHYFNTA